MGCNSAMGQSASSSGTTNTASTVSLCAGAEGHCAICQRCAPAALSRTPLGAGPSLRKPLADAALLATLVGLVLMRLSGHFVAVATLGAGLAG